jgi:hypothetical protein
MSSVEVGGDERECLRRIRRVAKTIEVELFRADGSCFERDRSRFGRKGICSFRDVSEQPRICHVMPCYATLRYPMSKVQCSMKDPPLADLALRSDSNLPG